MNEAQRIGAELVMLIRREASQMEELERTRLRLTALADEARKAESGIYKSTGDIPRVTDEYESAPQAMRSDRQDGGSTFRFHPVADAITETLPAAMSCDREICQEIYPHIHYMDGSITRIRDL